MRRRATALALLVVSALALPAAALGTLAATTTSSAVYAAAVLVEPSDLTAGIAHCEANSAVHVGLEWTATPSTFADGFEIRRVADDGPEEVVGMVLSPDVTAYVDTTATWTTTYTYTVAATASWWRSDGTVTATITTPHLSCGTGGPPGGGPPGGGGGRPGGGA